MKRRAFERWLRSQGARLDCNGSRHDIWVNGTAKSSVPRHKEIQPGTARAICKQLGVSEPRLTWVTFGSAVASIGRQQVLVEVERHMRVAPFDQLSDRLAPSRSDPCVEHDPAELGKHAVCLVVVFRDPELGRGLGAAPRNPSAN